MCGVIETWKTMKGKEDAQHTGIMAPTGELFPEMEVAFQTQRRRRRTPYALSWAFASHML